MTSSHLHRWRIRLLPCIVLPVSACTASSGPSVAGNAAAEVRPTETSTEVERAQALLDARYKAADVRYSFRTRAGADIDCVDFYAQPGVRALAARGEPIDALPTPPPAPPARRVAEAVASRPEDDLTFHGQPDVNGRSEECPAGSVPTVRITAEEIVIKGGLSGSASGLQKRPPPNTASLPPSLSDLADFAHVIASVEVPTESGSPLVSSSITFAEDTMAVYGPALPNVVPDHSLSQVWLTSGSNFGTTASPCTSDCIQSIEVGWTVDNDLVLGNTSTPHLFLFSTNNGYETGCYDDISVWNGYSTPCTPWVGYSGAPTAWNNPITFAAPGQTPTELNVQIELYGGNYWVYVQIGTAAGGWMGYFPGTNFSAPMNQFQIGGEVEDTTNQFAGTGIPMGSANPSTAGYEWAAYHRNYSASWVDGSGNTSSTSAASILATRSHDYTYSSNAGPATWSTYFFYGGTPPQTCVPSTCASLDAVCGSPYDGCGNALSCGTCGPRESCGITVCRKLL